MNPVYDFIQRNRMLARIEKAQQTKASSVDLVDFDLEAFPQVLFECGHLSSLNIGHNRIRELPIAIPMKNLQNLSLYSNNLDRFPEAIKLLTKLKSLNISDNPIKDLTSAIGSLTSLEILWCNNCYLTNLPEEIGHLVKLTILEAKHNQISKLPENLCSLENLRCLTLEDNKLHTVPREFDKLKMLIHLNLNKNNFNYIPSIISNLKKLRYLHLQYNQLYCIPETVLGGLTFVKINLLNNPLSFTSLSDIQTMFPNLIIPGKECDTTEEVGSDSDSSADDYENSIDSSDLYYSASESDSDDEEVQFKYFDILSKYLVTF